MDLVSRLYLMASGMKANGLMDNIMVRESLYILMEGRSMEYGKTADK